MMGLKSAGILTAHVVCGGDVCGAVRDHFSGRAKDRRLPDIFVHESADPPGGELPGRFLLLDGRLVYHPELFHYAVMSESVFGFVHDSGEPVGLGVASRPARLDRSTLESLDPLPLPEGTFAQAADSAQGLNEARRMVFKSLTKATDGWFSVHINRPVSLSITRLLTRVPVHPNWVTLIIFVIGVASGFFSALGTYLGFALGGILLNLTSVLDGVDGELSRLKFQGSRAGQWMDTVSDDLMNDIYLAGVTIGVYRTIGSDLLLWIGAAAVILDVVKNLIMYRMLSERFRSGSKHGFDWAIKKQRIRHTPLGMCLLAMGVCVRRDCYAILFMLLAVASCAWLILPAALTGILGLLIVVVLQLITGKREKRGT